MISTWWKAFLDILYPPRCPSCRKEVTLHGAWCERCLQEVLGLREINILEHHLHYIDHCLAVCEYVAGVKRIVHAIKYKRQRKYALHLRWLLEYGLKGRSFEKADVVVPVPLSLQRLKERGYNQVEAIFEKWSAARNLLWLPDGLIRIKNTAPQWELTLTERRKNMKDAFIVTRPECIENRRILLVDDIVTTGITLDECAKALKKAGAAKVYGLAVATGAS